jgi:hypothetical protein
MSTKQYAMTQHYYFSIHAEVEPRVVGEVPGGMRIDLGYKTGGTVTLKPDVESPLRGFFREDEIKGSYEKKIGEIASGQDWILIGTVGTGAVADFDGRVTIRFNDQRTAQSTEAKEIKREEGGASSVVGGHTKGRVDLRVEYAEWFKGWSTDKPLPLVLPLQLDIATVGPGGTWVEPLPGRMPPIADKLATLGRSLLLGIGYASCDKSKYSPLKSVDLDVYKITAEPK